MYDDKNISNLQNRIVLSNYYYEYDRFTLIFFSMNEGNIVKVITVSVTRMHQL